MYRSPQTRSSRNSILAYNITPAIDSRPPRDRIARFPPPHPAIPPPSFIAFSGRLGSGPGSEQRVELSLSCWAAKLSLGVRVRGRVRCKVHARVQTLCWRMVGVMGVVWSGVEGRLAVCEEERLRVARDLGRVRRRQGRLLG